MSAATYRENALKYEKRHFILKQYIQRNLKKDTSTPEIPALDSKASERIRKSKEELPPLKRGKGFPVSDPIFLNHGSKSGQNSVELLEQSSQD